MALMVLSWGARIVRVTRFLEASVETTNGWQCQIDRVLVPCVQQFIQLIWEPILMKVALAVEVDPIHFAVIAVLNLIIGLTTPPVGVCLFVASSIGKVSIGEVSRAGFPFLMVSLLVLVLVTLFPEISLFLPNLFME